MTTALSPPPPLTKKQLNSKYIRPTYQRVGTTLPSYYVQKIQEVCIERKIMLNAFLIELLEQKFGPVQPEELPKVKIIFDHNRGRKNVV